MALAAAAAAGIWGTGLAVHHSNIIGHGTTRHQKRDYAKKRRHVQIHADIHRTHLGPRNADTFNIPKADQLRFYGNSLRVLQGRNTEETLKIIRAHAALDQKFKAHETSSRLQHGFKQTTQPKSKQGVPLIRLL